VLSLRTGRTLAGSLTVLALAAYTSISVYRHEHYASNAFDLAVQDQTVWGLQPRREFIYNTVLGIPNLLGDHFHPMLATLAPVHARCGTRRWSLLVGQAVLLAVAGIPHLPVGRSASWVRLRGRRFSGRVSRLLGRAGGGHL